MSVNARLATEVGTKASLRVFASSSDPAAGACPTNRIGCHNAHAHVGTGPPGAYPREGRPGFAGGVSDFEGDLRWPTTCESCGIAFSSLPPDIVVRQVFYDKVYDTPSGSLEPGSLYFVDWQHWGGRCMHGWSNCDGRHLMAVLPTGHEWCVDGRASNCTLPNDSLHRCWVRTGELPKITVGKGGLTCSAGAGSIDVPGWHGFLRDGRFVLC